MLSAGGAGADSTGRGETTTGKEDDDNESSGSNISEDENQITPGKRPSHSFLFPSDD